jgi:multidrug efflux pump subunit AcrB
MEDQRNPHGALQEINREFGLSSLSVRNGTSVILLTFIIAIFGISAYQSMPKESFPEIVIPTIYVGTFYAGNSPVDMENLITRPIEKELKSLNGVKSIRSTSIQDFSTIIVEFNPDVEVAKALQDTKDAVDKAKNELPSDLERDPNVFEINFSEFPIMNINLSGNYSLSELKKYGEYLEDEIEKLPQISKVELKGALEREIRIDADPHRMEARNVSFSDIGNAVRSENLTVSGGNVLTGKFRRTLRVDGEFKTVAEIEDIIVKDENQEIVYLRDVATVRDAFEERTSYARDHELPVISLDVVKRSGENLLIAAEQIKKILQEAKLNRFPSDLKVTITNDQSRLTRDQISNLENSIIFGVILVVLVLMFFLNLRNALFVGIAIPMSMFLAFLILNAFGVTLNLMVLFSLILALGMLVDNGIVVVENIYRLMQQGYSPVQAAKYGAGEVALPIIASTATTLAAFLPLAFWGGIIGEFMKFLPITLIITLSSSLFVALVINPVLAARFMKVGDSDLSNKRKYWMYSGVLSLVALICWGAGLLGLGNLLLVFALLVLVNVYFLIPAIGAFQRSVLSWLENIYYRTIRFALRGSRPYLFLTGTFVLLVFSIMLLGISAPKVDFFPVNQPNYINIFVAKPIGTDIQTTNELVSQIERDVIRLLKPYDFMIESIIAQVGEGTADPSEGPQQGSTPNKARVVVSFVEYADRRGVSTLDIMELIRDNVNKYPGAEITVDKERAGPPVGKPINIEISGEDYPRLIALSESIKATIEKANVPGIEQLKSDLEIGKPELLIQIDREKARRFGLSTQAIATELRTALFGSEVSKFKDGEDDYKIQLRLKDEFRYDIDALINKRITFRDNMGKLKQVPIRSVAHVEYTSSYGSIKRKNLDRVITLFSNVKDGYNANEINSQLKQLLADYDMPEGFDYKFTGEQEKQGESTAFLGTALLIAVFSIFLIIVSQFNSISSPFIIMASVLFSTIGVFLGLVIFQMNFVIIMTGIGIISLAGVVVNNAIVLIDYTNLVRKRRRAELGIPDSGRLPNDEIINSIIEAGRTRLRPVLLTAITTVLGLIPLALGMNIDFYGLFSRLDPNYYTGGDNAAFWGPMAWTVIFGLTFATFLTLVIVPVMYLIADRIKISIGRSTT